MYNSLIRYLLQSFFFIALSAMLTLNSSELSWSNFVNITTSVLTLALLLAFTFFTYRFMQRN